MTQEISAAVANLDLQPEMSATIERWLTGARFASERDSLRQLIAQASAGDAEALADLVDAFSGTLPIGTGGRRGKVGPGPNRFNRVVVRETAQGVSAALKKFGDAPKVAIVYDTRKDSRDFALVAADQLAANGLSVFLIDAPRPTPELSFVARQHGCGAGIVVSASHNPPEDNGIKIYGPDGAQVLGERDRELMGAILAVAGMEELPLASKNDRARIEVVKGEQVAEVADRRYHEHVTAQGCVSGSLADAKLAVVFTPLHGVGHTSVVPTLRARGIGVLPVDRQCDPDNGQFSTVKSANPELPESMAMAIDLANEHCADMVLATDPDADRVGACVRAGDDFVAIDGNRLGVLMLDHILQHTTPKANAWVLTTLVTSPLIATLAKSRGVEVVDDLLVGFKHHAGMMREHEDRPLLFACEESHGYMRGNAVRDKDGAVAALLLAEAAALAKTRGETLLDNLDRIWCSHGYHRERTANLRVSGVSGRKAIATAMARWRETPPTSIGGLAVRSATDRYKPRKTGSPTRDLPGNVLVYELASETYACRLTLRPSGTEPKLKIYALARSQPGLTRTQLTDVKVAVDKLIDEILSDADAQVRANMEVAQAAR